MTYITQTTAHTASGITFYVNQIADDKGHRSFTVEAEGYEFGFSYATEAETRAEAEYRIWNHTQCDSFDAIA